MSAADTAVCLWLMFCHNTTFYSLTTILAMIVLITKWIWV